jgi:hypothetical protein
MKKEVKKRPPKKWNTRKALPSDLPNLSSFFKKQFQGSQRYGSADIFAWKIFENTVQNGFVNLIEDGNVIVSTTSITPKRLVLNGQNITAAEIGDTYTAEEYQRKGMFSILVNTSKELAQKDNIEFIYGTPNNQSLPAYIKNTGFSNMENLDVRSLGILFSAKSKFRRLVGYYLAELIDVIYGTFIRIYIFSRQIDMKRRQEYSLEFIETLPEDWEVFWSQAVLNYDFIFNRCAKSQEWRYFRNPEKYSFLTIRDNDQLIGYCVFRNIPEGDKSEKIIIADYLFLKGYEMGLALCLKEIFKKAFLTSIRSASVWCDLKSPYYPIFRKYGLRDTNIIPVIFYGDKIKKIIDKLNNSHFTMGDSDNV